MGMARQESASAKVILVGEHAVVYGMPAIALPLSQVRAHAAISDSDSALTVHGKRGSAALFRWTASGRNLRDPLAAIIYSTAQCFGAKELSGSISLCSDIPIASGLGSGAAVSAALARAVAAILDRTISNSDLNKLVYEVEKLHHGTPSGIDNTVIVYERPVYFVKDTALDFLDTPRSLHLVVADTGIAALTHETVAEVRELHQRQPRQTRRLLEEIGLLAETARAQFELGCAQELGELMTRNHTLLQQLGVSSSALDRLTDAALGAGAYGAKLSGAGRGGNTIALVDKSLIQTVESALLAAGAKRVFRSTVSTWPVAS